ncbi:MAG TPA: hypothetical protein DHD79_10420, partial [Firmicutes bacterium]|nr:hypothetical protein [Bacillota bacterium]
CKGGEERHGEYSGSITYFGIVPVPGPCDQVFVEIRRGGLLRKLVDLLRDMRDTRNMRDMRDAKDAGPGRPGAKGEDNCPSGEK